MLKLVKRTWEFTTLVVGAYAVYRQVKLFMEMKDEIYANLSEEEKAALQKMKETLPITIPSIDISDIEKLKAGL